MNQHLKTGLIAGIVAIAAVGAIESVLANAENDFFQFCTTKAYGWPAPWKIDYCECEGGKAVYPVISKIMNFITIAVSGITGFIFFGGISLLRRHRS